MAYLIRQFTVDLVSSKHPNLRKQKYVCTFKILYPNCADILKQQYGLKDNDKILVFQVRYKFKRKFKHHRTPFKKKFHGSVKEFGEFILNYYKKYVWKKKTDEERIDALLSKWFNELYPEFYERKYKDALREHQLTSMYTSKGFMEVKRQHLKYVKEEVQEIINKRKNKVLQFIQKQGKFPNKKDLSELL